MLPHTYFWKDVRIKLPVRFNRVSMYPLIEDAIRIQKKEKAAKIIFDFREIKEIFPVEVVVLSNLIEYFKKIKVKVELENYETGYESIRFLDEVGFFKLYLGGQVLTKHETKYCNMPLQLVTTEQNIGYLYFELIPWIATQSGLSNEETLAPLRSCIEEVLHNIEYHSGVGKGCTFTHYDPGKSEIRIAISDFGRTIPASVRAVRQGLLDHEAIKVACEEGFTTKSNVRNRGAGLPNLIQYVTQRNNGTILIASGTGEISAVKDFETSKIIPRPSPGFYPGTLVRIILKTKNFDKIVEDIKQEPFQWKL